VDKYGSQLLVRYETSNRGLPPLNRCRALGKVLDRF
jgi:hypothetical protein